MCLNLTPVKERKKYVAILGVKGIMIIKVKPAIELIATWKLEVNINDNHKSQQRDQQNYIFPHLLFFDNYIIIGCKNMLELYSLTEKEKIKLTKCDTFSTDKENIAVGAKIMISPST